MEQKNLPNVTISLVLVILGFLCCCIWGIPGIILGLIAFFLVRKDEQTYLANPEEYSNYSTLKTVKILALIVIVLGILTLIYVIYSISALGGWEGYMEKVNEMVEQYQ